MRILLVNDYATATGGAEIQMALIRSALRARGHDARLFASSAGAPPAGAADELCFGTMSWLRTPLQVANPFAKARLRSVIEDFVPDVVHVRMFLTQLSPLILPVVAEVPSLLHVPWYRPICPRGTKLLPSGADCSHPAGAACLREGCLGLRAWPAMMLQLALARRGVGAFNLVVAVGEDVRRELVAHGIDVAQVLPNGVQERPMRPPLSAPPTVGFAGRLVAEKGVDLLVEAFAAARDEVSDARLLIAGDGPERGRLTAQARALGLDDAVQFVGALDRAAVEERLDAAWVQAMPGRLVEPFGNAAAEALMRGTPLVTSERGGPAELVRASGGGAVVARNDTGALARALTARLADPGLCEAEGRRGHDWALRHLRLDDHVLRLERLYEELVEAGP